jgi:sulfane dehydrogenase subunit SoxC
MTEPIDTRDDHMMTSRRRFLRQGAAIGGAVLVGSLAQGEARAADDNLPPDVPEWMKAPGDPMGSQPYGTPSPFEKNVVKNIPKNLKQYISASGRTPLQDLDGIITPNGLFYERHHGGVPTIDPAEHRLMLHGLVDRPLIFTMDDIRRFPSQSRIHFIECSGNPVYTKPYGKTASDLVHGEDHGPIDEAVKHQAVLCWIDAGNAAMMPLVEETIRRNDAIEVL